MDLHQALLFLFALNSVMMSIKDGLIEKGKRDFPLFKLWIRD